MKIIDLLNKIANGEVPKKIKIDNKFTYIHDGIDYKNHDGTYLFDSYLETTTEDMNIEVEILEEPKGIPEKLPYYSLEKIQKAKNKDEWCEERISLLEQRVEDLHIKMNELLDYLESKGDSNE